MSSNAIFTMEGAPSEKVVLVNAQRLDFDQRLDFTSLATTGSVVRHYEDHPSDEAMLALLEGAAVIVNKEIPLSAALVAALPESVKLICEAGTGFNNVALDAARARGIVVTNVPAYSQDAVAQLVITFVLNCSCSMAAQQRMLLAGDRSHFSGALLLPHFELAGKTIGLVGGRGSIGTKVARLCLALGMRVLISSRDTAAPPAVEGTSIAASLDELLGASDFVSLHCPLSDGTRHLIGAAALAMMKPTAHLINTARGAIIDEAALCEALAADSPPIAGACLDVQEVEPLPDDSPLFALPNVVLTPHIGWKRLETRQRLMAQVVSNIKAFQAGAPINVVS